MYVKNETQLRKLLENEPDRIEEGMTFVASNMKPKVPSILSSLRKNIKLRGRLDLLLKDKDGCPVIVEIKGRTNPGRRREGLYQLVEYRLFFSLGWCTPRLIYLTLQNIRLLDEIYMFDIEPMFWDDIGIL